MKTKLILVKETVWCYPGIWATHYSILREMYKDLPDYMRSATKVAEADTYNELINYFKQD